MNNLSMIKFIFSFLKDKKMYACISIILFLSLYCYIEIEKYKNEIDSLSRKLEYLKTELDNKETELQQKILECKNKYFEYITKEKKNVLFNKLSSKKTSTIDIDDNKTEFILHIE